jgi:hypothetical protein
MRYQGITSNDAELGWPEKQRFESFLAEKTDERNHYASKLIAE